MHPRQILRAQAKFKAKRKQLEEEDNESDQEVPEETNETAADEHFYVGAVLNRRYIVLRFIDRGAYGRVWHAYDTRDHKGVALKTWIITGARGEKRRKEAMSEAQTELALLRRLRGCQGCVQSLDDFKVGDDGAQCAIIPFAGAICDAQLDAPNAEKAWRACARALQAAHGANVAHSDLKQRNILFQTDYSLNDVVGQWFWQQLHEANPDAAPADLAAAFVARQTELPGPPDNDPVHLDKCLLIDFRGTRGHVMPSWQFCAPEVLLDGAKGPKQDWWALACVGLYWVNGFHPFKPTRGYTRDIDLEREVLARITERLGQHAPKAIWDNYADHFSNNGRVKKVRVTRRPEEPLMEDVTPQMSTWLLGLLRWDVKTRVYPDLTDYGPEPDDDGTVVDGATTVILQAQ